MSDYMTFRPPTIQSYTHDSSNYASSPQHHTQPLGSINRSMTRGSYYSHLTASNSTRSWVQQTMQHPPPPPEEPIVDHSMSPPARASRPLPVRPISTLHTVNADPEEDFDDEPRYIGEYMTLNPSAATMRYGYTGFENGGGVADGGGNVVPLPRRMLTASPPPFTATMGNEPKRSKSFVGGFVRGLREKFGGGGGKNGGGEKLRKGTLRKGKRPTEEEPRSATLPQYQSEPPTPMGPPNMFYSVPDTSDMPTPTPANYVPYHAGGQVPQEMLADGALGMAQPIFRVTPPSEGSDPQIMESRQPQYAQVVHPDGPVDANGQRTTVMMYASTNESSDVAPVGRAPSRHTNRYSRVSTARAPSITIAPPPPVLQQHHHHHPPPPTVTTGDILNGAQVYDTTGASDVFSPATEHPLPSNDYLKMNRFTGSPSRSRATFYSRGTATSFYDPSFIEELSPVERFFKTLYHLPWVARGRLTVDYKPSEPNPSKSSMKKAMWYRRLSRAGKDLDMLSNGAPEPLGITPRTSANLTSMGSRRTVRQRRSKGSSGDLHRYYQQGATYRHRKTTRKRRQHRSTMSTLTEEDARRSPSPILPPVYPYPYPAYPYTYPGYAAMPPNMPPGQGTILAPIPGSPNPMADGGPPGVVNLTAQAQDKRGLPRSPRTKKSTRHMNLNLSANQYAHGYAPYQPMAFPPPGTPGPPVYVIHGSPTMTPMTPAGLAMQNGSPQQGRGGGEQKSSGSPMPQQQYYVPVQVVPGGWGTASSTASRSPPGTPTPRPASP